MKKAIQGFLAVLTVLLLMESFSRVLFTLVTEDRSFPDFMFQLGVESSAELGWQRVPNFNGRLSREPGELERRFDSHGFLLPDIADVRAASAGIVTDDAQGSSTAQAMAATAGEPSTSAARGVTILTIGDSSTFGWGVPPESTFSEILDRMLPDARIINLGVVGYSSYQGYKMLLKHAAILKPDLIIVSFNYNDRRYVLSAEDFDSDEKFSRDALGRKFNDITNYVYTYRALQAAMRRIGIIDTPGTGTTPERDARKLEARVPPETYRENLRKFARFGEEKQTPVIFLILGDNPAFTMHLVRGTHLLERSQDEAAIRALTIAARLDNAFSDIARKQLAVALQMVGDLGAASTLAQVQPQISVAGGRAIYLDSEYHAIMRAVAKEYSIAVVEASEALEEDPSMYLDFCHPDKRGHELIARLLHQAIVRRSEQM